jgi:hypothetical protein
VLATVLNNSELNGPFGGDCRRRDETERLEGVMFPDAYGVYRVNRQNKTTRRWFW